VPYDWATQWPGVMARHADRCPFSDGEMCTCGPLGYIATIADPDTGARVSSPLLETAAEARAWRSEQEWAVDPRRAAASNGNGHGPQIALDPWDREPEITSAISGHESRRRRAAAPEPTMQAPRHAPAPRPRHREPPRRAREEYEMPVSALIERFLDAAEDGEARGEDGRPFSDEELAEFEWALTGYVGSRFGDLAAGSVRGRHVFQLIDELEDAGMPRSRLRSVVDALRAMFNYATDLGLVRMNPATYVAMPGDDRRPRARLAETLETRAPRAARDAGGSFGDNLISERTIWMLVKIVALVFICIALVLVAESV
jgi:hypothetical protein